MTTWRIARASNSLVYNEALDGRNIEQTMHQLAPHVSSFVLQEAKSFIDSITRGLPPAVTAQGGYKSVELVESCYRSVSAPRASQVLTLEGSVDRLLRRANI
ncbi:MAG: hypothetical protein LC776_18925, partial [Acidobacteria bacterium]|nr:hypothetical protein [Acidobacteriota bacterium]